jgi:uncharacterized protein YkwD
MAACRQMRPWVAVLAVTAGCMASSTSPSSSAGTATTAPFPAEVTFCVDRMNALRATRSLPPLTRSQTLEAYATQAAKTDGTAHAAHRHARQTNHGGGLARAENEILWWSLDAYASVRAIVEGGLADMWRQGPGGTHFDNIVGPYTEAGCGIFVNGREVTVVQAFR